MILDRRTEARGAHLVCIPEGSARSAYYAQPIYKKYTYASIMIALSSKVPDLHLVPHTDSISTESRVEVPFVLGESCNDTVITTPSACERLHSIHINTPQYYQLCQGIRYLPCFPLKPRRCPSPL